MSASLPLPVVPLETEAGLTHEDFLAALSLQRLPTVTADVALPIEYTAACRAIAACRTIDDGKRWSDKADALAAWAKIYNSDQAASEARRLKLHAYRRMNDLAEQLRPSGRRLGPHGSSVAGARTLLGEHGLSEHKVKDIRRIGAIPKATFDDLVKSRNPPGVTAAAIQGIGHSMHGAQPVSSDSWRLICVGAQVSGITPRRLLQTFCRKYSAKEVACGLGPHEADAARAMTAELLEWLREFERYLPKPDKQAIDTTSGLR